MAKFRCPYGHTETVKGQLVPMTHQSRAACSIYVRLRAERKVDLFGRPIPGADITSYLVGRTPDPGTPAAPPVQETKPEAPPAEAVAAPAKPAEKPSLAQRLRSGLGIQYRTVPVTPPGAAGAPAGQSDWLVSPETSEQFFTVLIGFAETALNLVLGYFDAGSQKVRPLPKEIMTVDAGQSFIFRTAFRPTATNILKKVFGAQSPEQADRIVAGLSGILGFGMMAFKIVLHFMVEIPKSPRLEGWKKKRAEAKAERERVLELRREAEAQKKAPSPPPALPAGRPAP